MAIMRGMKVCRKISFPLSRKRGQVAVADNTTAAVFSVNYFYFSNVIFVEFNCTSFYGVNNNAFFFTFIVIRIEIIIYSPKKDNTIISHNFHFFIIKLF